MQKITTRCNVCGTANFLQPEKLNQKCNCCGSYLAPTLKFDLLEEIKGESLTDFEEDS